MSEDDQNNDEEIIIPDSYTYATIGTVIGAIAVLFMLISSFIIDPEASAIDRPRPIDEFIQLVTDHGSEILLFISLDSIFLVGYSCLFIGLYLIVRDFSTIMSKIALAVGLLVGLFDIVENAVIFTMVHGIESGWRPEPQLYALLFFLNMFIDLLSYAAALLFTIIFLARYRPGNIKFVLGLLLGLYVIIGIGSMIWPAMLLIRSFFFVLGLFFGVYVLSNEEDIPLEMLEDLMDKEQQARNDFIR